MKRAFSLLETVVVMGFAVVLLALAAQQSRPRSPAAQVRTLAQLMAQALRYSRHTAISSGQPCALVLPAGNGNQPLTQSCYAILGETGPHIVKTWNWSSDTSQAAATLATYPGPIWTAVPPPDPTAPAVPPTWVGPFAQDAMISFMSDGQVLSNRSWSQDAIHLVVGAGFLFANPNPAQLQSVSSPYLVRISRWGQVSVAQGLPSASAGVDLSGLPLPAGLLSPARNSSLSTNQPPSFTGSPDFSPKPSSTLSMVAPTSHITVPVDGLLTATVYGSDPDGDALSCEWTVVGNAGTFAAPSRHRMRWDSAQQRWTGRWTWHPPAGAAPGNQFQLECRLVDEKGASSGPLTISAALPNVQVIASNRLVYESGDFDLWTCNWDGTDPALLVTKEQCAATRLKDPRWSPDGRRVAFLADDHIKLVNRDGTDLHEVRDTGGNTLVGLCWDPAGRFIYVMDRTGNTLTIRQAPANGRNLANPLPVVASGTATTGSTVFLHMHASGDCWATSELNNPLGTTFLWRGSNVATYLPGIVELSFTPDGLSCTYDSGGQVYLRPISIDPVLRTATITPGPPVVAGFLTSIRLSPDGLYLYGQQGSSPLTQISLIRVDGSQQQILNLPTSDNDSPDWSYR